MYNLKYMILEDSLEVGSLLTMKLVWIGQTTQHPHLQFANDESKKNENNGKHSSFPFHQNETSRVFLNLTRF